MPTDAEIDFKPIKTTFPRSVMNSEGLPCILSSIKDPDGMIQWLDSDELSLQFDIDGGFTVTVNTTGIPLLTLSLDQVETIASHARVAAILFADWQRTPTGKAWMEKHSR